jgi:hypothetical protein
MKMTPNEKPANQNLHQSGWQRTLRRKRKRTKVRFLTSWLAEKKKDICQTMTVLTAEVGTAMTPTSWYVIT